MWAGDKTKSKQMEYWQRCKLYVSKQQYTMQNRKETSFLFSFFIFSILLRFVKQIWNNRFYRKLNTKFNIIHSKVIFFPSLLICIHLFVCKVSTWWKRNGHRNVKPARITINKNICTHSRLKRVIKSEAYFLTLLFLFISSQSIYLK